MSKFSPGNRAGRLITETSFVPMCKKIKSTTSPRHQNKLVDRIATLMHQLLDGPITWHPHAPRSPNHPRCPSASSEPPKITGAEIWSWNQPLWGWQTNIAGMGKLQVLPGSCGRPLRWWRHACYVSQQKWTNKYNGVVLFGTGTWVGKAVFFFAANLQIGQFPKFMLRTIYICMRYAPISAHLCVYIPTCLSIYLPAYLPPNWANGCRFAPEVLARWGALLSFLWAPCWPLTATSPIQQLPSALPLDICHRALLLSSLFLPDVAGNRWMSMEPYVEVFRNLGTRNLAGTYLRAIRQLCCHVRSPTIE